jgi:hypothetical protein
MMFYWLLPDSGKYVAKISFRLLYLMNSAQICFKQMLTTFHEKINATTLIQGLLLYHEELMEEVNR